MIAGEFDQLAERLAKAEKNIGELSRWCAEIQLGCNRAGISIVRPAAVIERGLIDMPDPEPLDRHKIHEEKEGKAT